MIYSSATAYEISVLTNRRCVRYVEMAFVVVAIFESGRPSFISKKALHKQAYRADILNRGVCLEKEWSRSANALLPQPQQEIVQELRTCLSSRRNAVVTDLANELASSTVPVRSCDPIQVWERHPVINKYLDALNDREIVAAIDAVYPA